MGKTLTAIAVFVVLGGCTSVTVQSAGGAQTTHHFGLAVVSPAGDGMWVHAKAYGIALLHSGAAFGVAEERTFVAPSRMNCSLIVVVEDAGEAERIRERLLPVLEQVPDACFFKGGKS